MSSRSGSTTDSEARVPRHRRRRRAGEDSVSGDTPDNYEDQLSYEYTGGHESDSSGSSSDSDSESGDSLSESGGAEEQSDPMVTSDTESPSAPVRPRGRQPATRVGAKRVSGLSISKSRQLARQVSRKRVRKHVSSASGSDDTGADSSSAGSHSCSSRDSPSHSLPRARLVLARKPDPVRSVAGDKYARLKRKYRALKRGRLQHSERMGEALEEVEHSMRKSLDLSKCAHKPAVFRGKEDSSSVRDWLAAIEHYLQTAGVPQSSLVDIAVSFLAQDAQRFWFYKAKLLRKEGINFRRWRVFVRAMLERYDHAEPEIAARYQLDKLSCRQGVTTVDSYVKQFEHLCSFIPKLSTGERIHRFITGLPARLADRVRVDPITCRRWTAFSDLVRYTLSQSADESLVAAAAALPGVVNRAMDRATHLEVVHRSQFEQRQGRRGHQSRAAGRDGGGWQVVQQRGGRQQGAYAQAVRQGYDPAARFIKVENKDGHVVNRSKAVVNFCMDKRLCRWCYGEGHQAADCQKPLRQGDPPGFGAGPSRAPQQRFERKSK